MRQRSKHRIRVPAWGAILAALVSLPASSDVKLVLNDGRILEGVDVHREGDLYELRTEGGDVISIPGALVKEVRLAEAKPEDVPVEQPGFVDPGPEQLAGAQPTQGIVDSKPEVLAGKDVVPPNPAEQLAALGQPSKFQNGVVDPYWRPSSDWDMNPANNNFAPSKWQGSIVDPDWKPTSDYSAATDVTDFAPSKFTKDIIDSSWEPKDAFKKENEQSSGSWPNSALPSEDAFELAVARSLRRTVPRPV